MTSTGKSLGYAYIATRQCGRVSGLAWEDVTSETDAAMLVREWTQRGDSCMHSTDAANGKQHGRYCEAHRAAVKTHGLCDWWARRSAQR